jgi:hypothetical protein
MEIHVARREITVTTTQQSDSMAAAGQESARPLKCPVCGDSEMLLLNEVVAKAGVSIAALRQGLQERQIHIHQSPSGECWVCRQSLPHS